MGYKYIIISNFVSLIFGSSVTTIIVKFWADKKNEKYKKN